MEKPVNNPLSPEDELRASNEILKLKLELEHGMQIHDTNELPPEIENQWLQNVYESERRYKVVGRISVYDFICRPAFTPYESLTPEELPIAITELIDHLRANGICLDFCCDYEDAVIYRFITEEFFAHEIDNIVLEGGTHCFIYEEFHPNHNYDLRRFSTNFVKSVVSKKWNEFETFVLGDTVSLHEKHVPRSGISSLIVSFQELHTAIEMEEFVIQNVHVDLENKKGIVRADLAYKATLHGEEPEVIEGPCILYFELGSLDWDIVQFEIPGL